MPTSESPESVDVKAIAQQTGLGVDQVRYFAARTAAKPEENDERNTERVLVGSSRFMRLVKDVSDIYLES